MRFELADHILRDVFEGIDEADPDRADHRTAK